MTTDATQVTDATPPRAPQVPDAREVSDTLPVTEEAVAATEDPPVHRLEVRDVRASYDDLPVLDGIDLTAAPGEFVSILGPSGSGKSTLFNVLTGSVRPDAGDILVDGAPLDGHGRHFAFMPQQDALLPWRRILDNLTLGLEVQGVRRRQARERVRPLLPTFGLDQFERSYPFQLSGGMRQRAALLRTVVQGRDVLLLDEPFGALDALTRAEMQGWLQQVWQEFRWTVLLITHDVREAVFLSDRIYVLSPRPAQVATVVEVPLARPRTVDVLTDPTFAAIEAALLRSLIGGADG
jgi:ABC-type nitrate/sulfonate/bicarbonate transport system ATPase subunit